MRKLLTLALLFLSLLAVAQPPNDDCAGLIDLGVAPFCPLDTFFTNVDATPSDIGNDNVPNVPACSPVGPMQRDVWFSFIASDTILDYTITVTGITDGMGSTGMIQPQVAVYRGDCEFDGLELLDCNAAELGETIVKLDLSGLDAGLPYYVRITDYSASATPNAGTFLLCIKEKDPIIVLDENVVTNLCFGEVYDSGGPDDDYSSNETYTLTIQPPAPVGCITFTLNYFNIDNAGDFISFYNGPSTTSPLISTISGANFSDEGGGGVCYTVTASSGALTMVFDSDGSVNLDGFYGSWECSQAPCPPEELIEVDPNITDTDILDNITTPTSQVTITDINCLNGGYGVFTASDFTDLGLEKGLLLTSGSATGAANPGAFFTSAFLDGQGDSDLDIISQQSGNGTESTDVCIIELDVYVATDILEFEYVFGSEEYPEYVGSSFNDIFAFLIDGPGIVGDPGLGAKKNIAVLPPPLNVPVQVNSVNNLTNWEYYRNNADGSSVAYDGLTSDFLGVKKSLTATIDVIPCNTYHLKLAVGDRGDTAFDSGVFISELKGGQPDLGVLWNNGIEYLVEECTSQPDLLQINLSSEQEEDVTYTVVIGGTATPGIDYVTTIPPQITFPAGVTSFSFPIEAAADGITEGLETITISLTNNFGCGDVTFVTLTIELYDNLEVDINMGQDTAFVCFGGNAQLSVDGALQYFWSPAPIFNNPQSPNPIATPTISQNVFVVGTLGVCTDVDTIFLQIVDPQVEIVTLDPIGICQGDSVTLTAVNNVGNAGLIWTPASAVPNDEDQTITVGPLNNITYTVSVSLEGCSDSDSQLISVDPFDFPELNFTDTVICQSYPVDLAEDLPNSSTDFLWTPNEFLSPSNTVSGPIATPEENTTYTLIATSPNAFCADTASLSVSVIPADVDILQPDVDSLELCLGDTIDMEVSTSTAGLGFTWLSVDASINQPTAVSTFAVPTITQTYYATLTIGACTVVDSVFVRVDSLPENIINQLIPDKETYCEGELITIASPTYEPANFPDIEHLWIPDVGFQSPDSLWNLVITATETTTYTRITNNRACSDTASVEIIVIPATEVSIVPDQAVICEGDSIQLQVFSPDTLDAYDWTPGQSLTCNDCPDPLAFPTETTTYEMEADYDGCPVTVSATIEVVSRPDFVFPEPATICVGDSIQLNAADVDPDATYTWLVNGTSVSNDPNVIVNPPVTTTYTLIIDKPGCDPIQEEITVFVISAPPTINVTPGTVICVGDEATIAASSDVPGTYVWQPGDLFGDIVTVSPTETTTYTVEFTSGCFVVTGTVTVEVSNGFSIDSITATPPQAFEGNDITFEAFTNPPTLQDPTYLWTLNQDTVGTTNPATAQAPSVEEDGTVFTYSVLITDAIGCSAVATVDVIVDNSAYEIPNIFTPNGDEANGRFTVLKNEAVEIVEFKIYNRWGQLVYDNEDGNTGWDGTQNDLPAPSDVYGYLIILQLGDGTEVVEKGEVTLLR